MNNLSKAMKGWYDQLSDHICFTKKSYSFDLIISVSKRRNEQGTLKIPDITASLYHVNLILTKIDRGSR